MALPRISFISSLHNCLPLTKAMLASLRETVDLSDKEIVLVDDCSSDGTKEYLQTLAAEKNVRILENKSNLGFAASNNRGVAAAQGELLVFINNDLEFSKDWFVPMLEGIETLPHAGAVGNVQRNFSTGLVDHAGIFFDLDGMPTHAHKNRANPPKGRFLERNAVTAACMIIGKNTFLELDSFDEGYRNGFEDVDLCMKLKSRGFRLYVALESVIRHHISVSPGRNASNEANSELFRSRWSDFAKPLGEKEWAREYYRRYARFWWRMNPRLACKAALRLALGSGPNRATRAD